MIKDLFGILVIENVNSIKVVILVNIYENCKCRKKLVDKLIDECTKTIEEVKLAEITPFENENNDEYNSCRVYIVLMIVVFTIFTRTTVCLVYHNWSLINNNIYCIKFNNRKKKTKI